MIPQNYPLWAVWVMKRKLHDEGWSFADASSGQVVGWQEIDPIDSDGQTVRRWDPVVLSEGCAFSPSRDPHPFEPDPRVMAYCTVVSGFYNSEHEARLKVSEMISKDWARLSRSKSESR